FKVLFLKYSNIMPSSPIESINLLLDFELNILTKHILI
ncbi:hypothetical protein WANA13_1010, partial [Wolbachia endosymbiont of Drosophila ananassae]